MRCRHAMLVDQTTERIAVPLNINLESKGKLELANSTYHSVLVHPDSSLILSCAGSLSEMAVLGVS